MALLATVLLCATSQAVDVTWTGATNTDWMTGTNWNNGTGLVEGDVAIINSGTPVFSSGTTPAYNALRQSGGTVTFSGGIFNCANQTTWESRVDATLLHTGTMATINSLEIGRSNGATGLYTLSGGNLKISRGHSGTSLYLGTNRSAAAAGTGTLEISGGTFSTRAGVKLGDSTAAGTGHFTVLGSVIGDIGIGKANTDTDGTWVQNAGSKLKVGIDFGGVTPILIKDSATATTGTSATFAAGALLDVGYYNGGYGGGTWTVMEVENGDIFDNGLAFAPGVNTAVWSFSIDNSGANGVLKVTATGTPAAIDLTVGNTKRQKMRYGLDYERLWFWTGPTANRNTVARWSMVDCDVDYIRVAINAKYELTEGTFDSDAYFDADGQTSNDRIIPMMQAMKAFKPDIKFFASPRPLDEAYPSSTSVAWQPYPIWITGAPSLSSTTFNFNPQKCAEYLVRYLLLMKSHGFKISFMDLSNEWNFVNATDVRDISAYFDSYLLAPWSYSGAPGVVLTADDIPQLIAPSAWSYSQGSGWLVSVNTTAERNALDIAACHNTDKTGTAQTFADRVATYGNPGTEVWNTELHGWKSTDGADEVLSSAYLFECIRAGFSGISGWLAIGQPNQGHSYILNENGIVERNVKYFIFRKLSTTSNYGNALDINQPVELAAAAGSDEADAGTSTAALIRGNLMTVWVMNHADRTLPIRIAPTGRTLSETTVKWTRWSEAAALPVEGVTDSIPASGNASVWSSLAANSVYCFEILLNPIGPQFGTLQGEAANASSGTTLETTGDIGGGQNVTNISRNDWLRFDNLAPGTGSVMRFRIARPADRPEGRIEIRLDSTTGEVIGSIALPTTAGWQNYETIEATLAPVSGRRNIFLVFTENGTSTNNTLANLNWMSLIQPPNPATFVSNPTATTSAQATLNWTAVSGATGYQISRSTTPGGPYTLLTTATGTSYTNTGLTTGTSYYYVIKTLFAATSQESANSAELRITASAPLTVPNYTITNTARQTAGATDNFIITIAQSGLGQFYQVESNATLSGTWTNEGSTVMGTGGQLQFTQPIGGAQRKFYRVRVWRE